MKERRDSLPRRSTGRPSASIGWACGAGQTWTSPRTGAVYPAGWTITVPSAGLALELAPLVAACELASKSADVTYWEGPVAVSGSVTGRGYAELTGYAGSMSGRF